MMRNTFDTRVIVAFEMFGTRYEIGHVFVAGSLERTLRQQLMHQGKIVWNN